MTVLHVDANSAYLSWTAVALLEAGYGLDIREVPSVIAGDPDNRHGIILAKSIPAKKKGIGTAMSLFEAENACPELLKFPPDYDLFMAASDAMYEILSEYSPLIERYSIDESFVDYRPGIGGEKDPVSVAHEIRNRIRNELGFTVNVGVGPNKVLAKMACELEKPDKVHTLLTEKEMREKLWPLPVSELFMVGRASTRKLRRININTIGDLATSDEALMRAMMKSHGSLIWRYANGIDASPVTPNENIVQKGIGNSMTVDHDVEDIEEAGVYLLSLTERVGMRLRRHRCKASLVSVSICENSFFRYSHQLQLPFFTSDTDSIYRVGLELLEECWSGRPIRQLGIRTGEFTRDDEYQLSVFDAEDVEKVDALNSAVDGIRKRFGTRAIQRGTFTNNDYRPIEGGVNEGNFLMMGGFRQ